MKKFLPYKVLLFLILHSNGYGQEKTAAVTSATINLIAKAYGDSIVLRWAPSSASAWQLLNTTGYHVLRIQSNSADARWITLNEQPVVPLSLEQMKQGLDRNNRYAAIAAQALYGKKLYAVREGMAPSIADNASLLQDRYALTLQCADFSSPVAKAVALGWVDKTVKKDEVYIYKVIPAQPQKAMNIQGLSLIVVNQRNETRSIPEGLSAFAGDRKIELQWPRSQTERYSGYDIEISEDGKSFRSITDAPYYSSLPDSLHMKQDSLVHKMMSILEYNHLFIDSVKQNYRNYTYRIRGINAFGEWSSYSESVTISARDLTPPSSLLLGKPEPTGKKNLKLSWVKPVKETDLKGYYVYRSGVVDAGYSLLTPAILPVQTDTFTDTAAFEQGPNFYIVTAVDTAGNLSPSLPVMGLLPDTTAPAIPTGLSGRIDQDGLVHLNWTANREEDLQGYKVYWSHQPDQSFMQLTLYPATENSFTDSITLRTLTKKIYYRIVSVDKHNNHSEYSSILELKKPDIVPPTPPVIKDVTVLTTGPRIEFYSSASTDAAAYEIFRREGEGSWKSILKRTHDSASLSFTITDTSVKRFVKYYYAAKTIDEDSLSSVLCTPVSLTIKGTEELPVLNFSKAAYDQSKKAVRLEWNYKDGGDYYFVLYRSLKGEPLERFQTLEKSFSSFEDEQLNDLEKGYQYAIQAVYRNNSKMTKMGNPVPVTR